MKIMCCDLCHGVIPMTQITKKCKCGNISGKYKKDGRHAIVSVREIKRCRVIGINNSVRYGLHDNGDCWIINWNDDRLETKIRGGVL